MISLFESLFSSKPFVIAGVHFLPLPGSIGFDRNKGVKEIVDRAKYETQILVDHGVDAILFANEADYPWNMHLPAETVSSFTAVVQELSRDLQIPYGINALTDSYAGLSIAYATNASFIRGYFSGVFATDLGLMNTNGRKTAMLRNDLHAENIHFIHNLDSSFAVPIINRSKNQVIRGAITQHKISTFTLAPSVSDPEFKSFLQLRKEFPEITLLVGRGVNFENISSLFQVADGFIVASCLKEDGKLLNITDKKRVKEFMSICKRLKM